MDMEMTQKKALVILVVILVLFGAWIYLDKNKASSPDGSNTQQERGDASFSFSGVVTKIDGNKITFKTGSVQETSIGQQYVEQEVTFLVTDQTTLNQKDLKTTATLGDLKVGNPIVAYFSINPIGRNETAVESVLIRN